MQFYLCKTVCLWVHVCLCLWIKKTEGIYLNIAVLSLVGLRYSILSNVFYTAPIFKWWHRVFAIIKIIQLRHLGGSVGWTPKSWFWPRSLSQGHGIRLCTKPGACLRFTVSLCPSPRLMLSLKKKNKKTKKKLLLLWEKCWNYVLAITFQPT